MPRLTARASGGVSERLTGGQRPIIPARVRQATGTPTEGRVEAFPLDAGGSVRTRAPQDFNVEVFSIKDSSLQHFNIKILQARDFNVEMAGADLSGARRVDC